MTLKSSQRYSGGFFYAAITPGAELNSSSKHSQAHFISEQ